MACFSNFQIEKSLFLNIRIHKKVKVTRLTIKMNNVQAGKLIKLIAHENADMLKR